MKRKARSTPKGRQVNPQALEEVRSLLGDEPRRRDLLIEHLHKVNDRYGHLSAAHLAALAQEMRLAMAEVYEVATFYSMYNLQPTGKYKITMCTCLPCGLQGALAAADHLRQKLGIDFNETTPDGRFTLKEGECMGACAMAPVLLVNNKKMHDYMTNDKLDALLKELK